MGEHIAKDHGKKGFRTCNRKHQAAFGMAPVDFDKKVFLPVVIKEGGQTFFMMCGRSPEGQWYFWVYMIGSKAECEKWTYTVRFHSKGEKKKGLSFCGPCVPPDIPPERAAELGLCLQFNDGTAKRFCSDDKIRYEFRIEKEE